VSFHALSRTLMGETCIVRLAGAEFVSALLF
jgi:hypothetical protein